MTIYIILGLLGDGSEYVVDANILMPILGTTKVNLTSRPIEASAERLANGE